MSILQGGQKSGEAVKNGELEVEILILRENNYGKKHFVVVKVIYKVLSFETSLLQEMNVLMISALST